MTKSGLNMNGNDKVNGPNVFSCGERHGKVEEKLEVNKENIHELGECLQKKVSTKVFNLAVAVCITVFSFYAGWLWRIDNGGVAARQSIADKNEKKWDELLKSINEIKIDLAKLAR